MSFATFCQNEDYFHLSLKAACYWDETFQQVRDLSTNPGSENTAGESGTHSESAQPPWSPWGLTAPTEERVGLTLYN